MAENWTTKFENPSGFSHLEVEIALRAWESGTTRFRVLTGEEWRAWLEARFQPEVTSSSSPGDPSSADSYTPTSEPADMTPPENVPFPQNVPPAKDTPFAENALCASPPANGSLGDILPEERVPVDAETSAPTGKRIHAAAAMSVSFINSATPAAGETFIVPKANRKKRSDAGVPRGPRKKHASATSENVPPTVTPAVHASKSRARCDKQAAATESNMVTPAA